MKTKLKILIVFLFFAFFQFSQSYITGKKPIITQMHIHGWSNHNGAGKPGSLQYHNWQANLTGIDVLWWSEHHVLYLQDTIAFNFNAITIDSSNLNLVPYYPDLVTRIDSWECLNKDGYSNASMNHDTLTMSLIADNNPENRFGYSPRSGNGLVMKTAFCKTIASEPIFNFKLKPTITDYLNSRIQFTFRLAWHYREKEQQDIIIFKLVHSSVPSSVHTNNIDTVIVTLPVENIWQEINLNLLSAANLLNHGSDNTISDIKFELISGYTSQIEASFNKFRLIPEILESSMIVQKENEFLELYTENYRTNNILGVEYSGKEHLNGYFPSNGNNTKLFEGTLNFEPKQWVDSIHAKGGLTSYNHMFGVNHELYSDENQEYRSDSMAMFLLANQAHGADILEVGYLHRGGCDLDRHLQTWDKLTANGLYLYGNGVSDFHGNNWINSGDIFHTYIWAEENSENHLLESLSKGKMFFSNHKKFRGEFYYSIDNLEMGDRGISNHICAQPIVHLSPPVYNCKIKLTQILLENGTELEYLYNRESFDNNNFPFLYLDKPSFIRFEVYDENDDPLIFGQPIVIFGSKEIVENGVDKQKYCDPYNKLNLDSKISVEVLPNPNFGEFVIISNSEIELFLTDEVGKIISQFTCNSANNFKTNFTLHSGGIYFLNGKFKDENGFNQNYQNKIIVAK